MTVGIGGGGYMGLAFETVPGTYVAPTKFFPITSESLKHVQETVWQRALRKNVDVYAASPGNVHIEGDIEMPALEDVVIYFLYATRATVVKSGTTNYVYTVTPNDNAQVATGRTLSLTVVRNGIVFGYTNCVLGNFTFGVEDGMMTFKAGIVGSDEASQSLPTPTFVQTTPFGAGQWVTEIPTTTGVYDVDTFEFTVEDNAEPQYRLQNQSAGGRGAQFIKYGERSVQLTVERDFQSRTDYDAFKALTAQSVTIKGSKGTNNTIELLIPKATKDTYEVGLSGQGDLVRASIAYQGVYDNATSKSYEIVVKTQESIT